MITEPTYTVPFLYDILQHKSAPVTAPVSLDVPGSKSITNRPCCWPRWLTAPPVCRAYCFLTIPDIF